MPFRHPIGRATSVWTALILGILLCLGGASAAQTAGGGAPDPPGEQFVSIDFNNVDIGLFIKFMSELTGTNFVVDNAVKGKVTIISPARISLDEAYRVFESVLDVYGFAAVKAGDVVKIVPSPAARSSQAAASLLILKWLKSM